MCFNRVIAICQSNAEDTPWVLERSQQFHPSNRNAARAALAESSVVCLAPPVPLDQAPDIGHLA